MSVPAHNTINGYLTYNNKIYNVLNQPLPEELINAYNDLDEIQKKPYSSAPWRDTECSWEIKENKLFLTELYATPNLLKQLSGKNELEAHWVETLNILIATETPLVKDDCQDQLEILHLVDMTFTDAILEGVKAYTSTDFGIQMRRLLNYFGIEYGIFTFDKSLISLNKNKIEFNCTHENTRYSKIEKEINAMMHVSQGGIDLNSNDFQHILNGSSKLMYISDDIKFENSDYLISLAERLAHEIEIVAAKLPNKYLMYFSNIDKNLSSDFLKVFIETLEEKLMCNIDKYYNFNQDESFIFGISDINDEKAPLNEYWATIEKEIEKLNSSKNKVVSHEFTIQIFIGL